MSQYLIRKHRKWSTRLNNASAANAFLRARRLQDEVRRFGT